MNILLQAKSYFKHRRHSLMLLCAAILCSYLSSLAAIPLASFFIVDKRKTETGISLLARDDIGALSTSAGDLSISSGDMEYSDYSSVYSSGYKRTLGNWSLASPSHKTIRTVRGHSKKSSRKDQGKKSLSESISEQRDILATLEAQKKSERLLELIGDNNLLLMLNTQFSRPSYFINRWLEPSFDNKEDRTVPFDNFAQGNKLALKLILKAPQVVNLSQTANVEAIIDWSLPNEQSMPKTLPTIEADLESPDFKIVTGNPGGQTLPLSNGGTQRQAWVWLISPEKSGDRKISLSFRANGNRPVPILTDTTTTGYNAIIPVTVLDELGLSSSQAAWAKAIGAIIGIIGTIAGYSFLKRRTQKNKLKNKSADEDNSDDHEETLDAEIILRELARHLKEQQVKDHSDSDDKEKRTGEAKEPTKISNQ